MKGTPRPQDTPPRKPGSRTGTRTEMALNGPRDSAPLAPGGTAAGRGGSWSAPVKKLVEAEEQAEVKFGAESHSRSRSGGRADGAGCRCTAPGDGETAAWTCPASRTSGTATGGEGGDAASSLRDRAAAAAAAQPGRSYNRAGRESV